MSLPTARLLGQATSNRSQVVSDLFSALEQLQEDLNSGVMLQAAFVSSQTREGVDRLGTCTLRQTDGRKKLKRIIQSSQIF